MNEPDPEFTPDDQAAEALARQDYQQRLIEEYTEND